MNFHTKAKKVIALIMGLGTVYTAVEGAWPVTIFCAWATYGWWQDQDPFW
jgi:hypothetical protein